MASVNFFNGRTSATPGSFTKVDATGLAVVGLGATGIIAALGEAEGASPWNGATPVHNLTNPGKVGDLFREGDLREAAQLLFQPSTDEDIPGGAQAVKFVKVNPATQSTATFGNGAGDALTVTSEDYGVFTTQINVLIEDGTTSGKKITVTLDDIVEVFDDVGGDAAFTALYTPGGDGATTMTMALTPAVGIVTAWTKTAAGLDTDVVGSIDVTGRADDITNPITAAAVVSVVSDDVADTGSVTIFGTDNATGDPASETLTLSGTTPVNGTQQWATVTAAIMATAPTGTVIVSDQGDSDTLITITSADADDGLGDFGGDPLEVANTVVSVVLDAVGTHEILLFGTDSALVAASEKLTSNGTTPVTSTTVWSEVQYIIVGAVPNARTVTLSAHFWNSGEAVRLVSSSVADTQSATIYGLDDSGDPQTEVVTLTGTTAVTGSATWSKIMGLMLDSAADGTVSLTDTAGDLTVFALTAAETSEGLILVDNVALLGTAATVVADAATTQDALLVGLSATGAAQVEKITLNGTTPVVGTSTWSTITAVVTGHLPVARTLTVSGGTTLPIASYTTVNDVSNYFNALQGWTLTVSGGEGLTVIGDMDTVVAGTVIGSAKSFGGDLASIVATLNAESDLVTAAAASGATGAPSNTAGAVFLAGGVEGATSFSDWQGALDVIRDEFVNTVVALTDDSAIHAAVKAHCIYMGGAGGQERDAVLGAASGVTKTAWKAGAQALNSRHVRYCGQDVKRINVSGSEEVFPPYFTACLAAGMQAGSTVGTSLTRKYVDVLNVEQDSSVVIQDDSDELIQAGCLALQYKADIGWRWLRNITTYLIDDNPAFTEAAVNEAVNYTAYSLRTALEVALGKKAFSGTANSILDIAVQVLTLLSDPNGQFAITDWRNLTVEIVGDVARVDVEVAPVQSINFVNTTLHLVTGSFSAAA